MGDLIRTTLKGRKSEKTIGRSGLSLTPYLTKTLYFFGFESHLNYKPSTANPRLASTMMSARGHTLEKCHTDVLK